eukprot:11211032-Lingulodinium_polyedra.AAC.1
MDTPRQRARSRVDRLLPGATPHYTAFHDRARANAAVCFLGDANFTRVYMNGRIKMHVARWVKLRMRSTQTLG